jgi:hypothetical protein
MKKSLILLTIAVTIGGFWLTGCAKNEPPVINSLTASDTLVTQSSDATITCDATDPDADDALTYTWSTDAGDFAEGDDPGSVIWTAPDAAGAVVITCIVTDGNEESEDTATVTITVAEDYFPKDIGYIWNYIDEFVNLVGADDTLFYDAEVVGGGESDGYWEVQRHFYSAGGGMELLPDTLIYTIASDSVVVDDPNLDDDYLGLLFPLWVDKTWDTGEGGTVTVTEIGDVTVPEADYTDCFHIVITGGEIERDFWLAPDVGMIRSAVSIDTFDFELELWGHDF